MLKAEQARDLLSNSKEAIKKQLAICEKAIRKACADGKNSVDVALSEDYFIPGVETELKAHGYKSQKIHSRWVNISW